MTGRPVPVPDAVSAPFWRNCARHVLSLPRCSRCHAFSFPPEVSCPKCHSTEPDFAFEEISGNGTLRTWTVVWHSFLQGFETPFVLADVELDDTAGVRLIGRLLDGPDAELAIGARVRVAFEDVGADAAVPGFRLEQAR